MFYVTDPDAVLVFAEEATVEGLIDSKCGIGYCRRSNNDITDVQRQAYMASTLQHCIAVLVMAEEATEDRLTWLPHCGIAVLVIAEEATVIKGKVQSANKCQRAKCKGQRLQQ